MPKSIISKVHVISLWVFPLTEMNEEEVSCTVKLHSMHGSFYSICVYTTGTIWTFTVALKDYFLCIFFPILGFF